MTNRNRKRIINTLPRCFAHRDDGGCSAITVDRCGGYKFCEFYRSVIDHRASVERAHERLRGLSHERQAWIAGAYYKGERPWGRRNDAD